VIVYITPAPEPDMIRRAEKLLMRFPEVDVVVVPSASARVASLRIRRRANARWARRYQGRPAGKHRIKQRPPLIQLAICWTPRCVEFRRAS